MKTKKSTTGIFSLSIRKIASFPFISGFSYAFASSSREKQQFSHKTKTGKKFNKGAGSLFLFIPFLALFCLLALYIQPNIVHTSHPIPSQQCISRLYTCYVLIFFLISFFPVFSLQIRFFTKNICFSSPFFATVRDRKSLRLNFLRFFFHTFFIIFSFAVMRT